MSHIWPQATMRELIALAETKGESKATLGNNREATLFRFALYGFRRTQSIGEDLLITIDKNTVVVRKRPQIEISIDGQPASSESL